jgi:DNA-binding NarL/FixJ family response regulator
MFRVFLVDDEAVVRAGMRGALGVDDGFKIVGEAGSAREAFLLVERAQPDIIIVDLVLPGMDGIAATRELRRRVPAARVLILTVHARLMDAIEALSAGAAGFALKTASLSELIDAVKTVGRGERYVAPSLRATVEEGGPGTEGDVLGALSTREREVFQQVADGLRIVDIARELCISRKTVETHISRIYRKIGCSNVADLVRFAARHGLLRFHPRSIHDGGLGLSP